MICSHFPEAPFSLLAGVFDTNHTKIAPQLSLDVHLHQYFLFPSDPWKWEIGGSEMGHSK
jgi:hypothetical protein